MAKASKYGVMEATITVSSKTESKRVKVYTSGPMAASTQASGRMTR